MHEFTPEVEELAKEILDYSLIRLRTDPPLDGPKTAQELYELAGNTITAKGLGGHEALKLFKEVLATACISTDHPRYLAFIPSAPSEYANLFDLVVGASALYGGSWLEGAGAVFAENQALKWISDLAGMPATAGGVFVQGGTIGNLSALAASTHLITSFRLPLNVFRAVTNADRFPIVPPCTNTPPAVFGIPARSEIHLSAWFSAKTAPAPSSHEPP